MDLPITYYIFSLMSVVSIGAMGVALGTTRWVTYEILGFEVHLGLFEYCTEDDCKKFDDDNGLYRNFEFNTVKGLCIAAIGFVMVGFCILQHFICFNREAVRSKNQGWLCFAICLISGLLAFSGVAIFRNNQEDEASALSSQQRVVIKYTYGYCYFLAWVSGAVAILSAIFGIVVVSHFFKRRLVQEASNQAINSVPGVNVITGQNPAAAAAYPGHGTIYPGGNPNPYHGTPGIQVHQGPQSVAYAPPQGYPGPIVHHQQQQQQSQGFGLKKLGGKLLKQVSSDSFDNIGETADTINTGANFVGGFFSD